ncbi:MULTISPECIES: hypothetical protein [unclassified Streptomyces]|uniref:hypothetical protein n=1 Tax=unclassified Streptomyces TaxID=2593676 RepID=UPI00202ED69E|nr:MULTISPECIES: hypothetical protein [unclassified Streptomyces]MCM1972081.1 hypothetical protein [Streptomyces sp. G1]MCX5125485.1 hypothetical protein [Streptomyces sp. NBC_00347]
MLPLIHLHPTPGLFHQDVTCADLPAPVADIARITEAAAHAAGLAPCQRCKPVVWVRHGVDRKAFHTDRTCFRLAIKEDTCGGYGPHSKEEAEGPMKLRHCKNCKHRDPNPPATA